MPVSMERVAGTRVASGRTGVRICSMTADSCLLRVIPVCAFSKPTVRSGWLLRIDNFSRVKPLDGTSEFEDPQLV